MRGDIITVFALIALVAAEIVVLKIHSSRLDKQNAESLKKYEHSLKMSQREKNRMIYEHIKASKAHKADVKAVD